MHIAPRHLKAIRRSRQAFTLVELVLVLTLIALLMGVAIYSLNKGGFMETGQDIKINADIQAISSALDIYQVNAGRYPTTEQGLEALMVKPAKAPVPDRWHSVLEEMPLDPWKQTYKYRYPGTKSKKSYDIYSIGKNGIDDQGADGSDDVGNWKASEKK